MLGTPKGPSPLAGEASLINTIGNIKQLLPSGFHNLIQWWNLTRCIDLLDDHKTLVTVHLSLFLISP